jgi:hypothetical protein
MMKRKPIMSQLDENRDCKALPKPIALTPDWLSKIAAGTAGALPAGRLQPGIKGGISAGPVWEGLAAGLATQT